jgi:hypothetical protein
MTETLQDSSGTPFRQLPGVDYRLFLQELNKALQPRSYLEVGSQSGESAACFSCETVCVDPQFQLCPAFMKGKSALHLYQMTSDLFFRGRSVRHILGGPVDVCFLDGLHLFEYLLRDFISAEQQCEPESVILIHDCIAPSAEVAERVWAPETRNVQETKDWWAGDVWKLLPVLKEYRPDLRIMIADCPPTGLVICTNLDPRSEVLSQRYYDITSKWSGEPFDSFGREELLKLFPVLDSQKVVQDRSLTAYIAPFSAARFRAN